MPTLIGASDKPLLMGTTQAEAPSARRQRSSSLLSSMLKSVSVNSYVQSSLKSHNCDKLRGGTHPPHWCTLCVLCAGPTLPASNCLNAFATDVLKLCKVP